MPMLGSSNAIAFVATTNAQAARQFYERVLGLRFVADEHFALVFDLNGRMLRIFKIEAHTPAEHTVLGWDVKDIDTAVDQLIHRGVTFEHPAGLQQNARGIWQSPSGAQIAWFKDPDGNVLSLTQFA
jgi:catechol 2,3-dioxygenase-like lactoylglutathione lyase family enzyme